MALFAVGDQVEKTSGLKLNWVVVSVFDTLAGALHIYNEKQLMIAE